VHKPMKPPNIVKTMAIIKKKERGGLAENFYQMTVAKFANGTARVLRSDRRRRSPVISR